eukprot:gene26492-26924_t
MSHSNILVTGTPGTGKSTFCAALAAQTGLTHIDISQLVTEKGLDAGNDDERGCLLIDEDKVCDELEDEDGIDISSGGKIVECHAVDFFPERYFKLVLVLRTDNTVLWERLASRGYPQSKIQENVQAEIMQVLLEESRDSYKPEIVKELQNDTIEQLEQNVVNAVKFVQGVV